MKKVNKLPHWKYGISLTAGTINSMNKNGKPYYYPVRNIAPLPLQTEQDHPSS